MLFFYLKNWNFEMKTDHSLHGLKFKKMLLKVEKLTHILLLLAEKI